MTALYVVLVALVVVASVGVVPLRRYQDRQWAEYLARERFKHYRQRYVMGMPAMVKLAADFERVGNQLREAMMPSMQRMAETMAGLAPKLEALGVAYRELPWWRRVWWRIQGRFTR